LLFDCVDDFSTKFVLSECAVRKKIPHISAGMFDINAFCCIFAPPITPCFHCLIDNKKLELLQEMQQYYARIGTSSEKRTMVVPVCAPTLFLITGFLMGEAIKIILGIGEPEYNKYILILQKSSGSLVKTAGYQATRFWNTTFFDKISLEQGFDWDIGWRGNVFEQILLRPNPDCECCSSLHFN